MSGNLRDIIYSNKRERIYTESTTIGGIICPLIKMEDWDVYIYGAGIDISCVVSYFLYLGIDIKGVLDSDPKKEGKMILDKVPVIYPQKISKKFDSEKTFVIINTMYFKGIEQYEILSLLRELGITKFYELAEFEKNEIKAKPHPRVDIGRLDYYRENVEKLQKTYDRLYDIHSKEIMLEFIRAYVEFGTYKLEQCSSEKKYFYGQKQDRVREELYKHLDDEVWINCGSNNGDTIFWYFANGLQAKAVYAYEADEKIYERLVKNIKYLPAHYGVNVHLVNEFINDQTDWERIEDKITLINADVEGGELDLLKSLESIIIANRPVLAICVYHKPSDLVEIPDYIQSIVGDYCFVLRKYESNVDNVRRTAELVLYAIPKERISDDLQKGE